MVVDCTQRSENRKVMWSNLMRNPEKREFKISKDNCTTPDAWVQKPCHNLTELHSYYMNAICLIKPCRKGVQRATGAQALTLHPCTTLLATLCLYPPAPSQTPTHLNRCQGWTLNRLLTGFSAANDRGGFIFISSNTLHKLFHPALLLLAVGNRLYSFWILFVF